ncbi:MAG: LexA family transcriptional regulator [Alphaproteobacteria bacterium]|nr:LexA family transcriptional regulator [Alphaproteobacteria bacterium]
MPTQNPIGSRLKAQMHHCDISSAELAKRADVKTSFIYDVLSGKSANPSPAKLARLAEVLGISLSALIGSADARDEQDTPPNNYVAISRITVSIRAGSARVLEEKAEPYYFREAWVRERLGANPSDMRMMRIVGDGMEPTLCNGDMVMLNVAKKTATPPGIFVLFDGNDLAVKRLEYLAHEAPPRLRIMSDNKKYAAYERLFDEATIIGRVVWFAREI